MKQIWDFNKYSGNTAFVEDNGKSVTYEEIGRISEELYQVTKGRTLVFVLCENTIGCSVGYAAFMSKGLVPLMLNAKLERELLDNLILIYQPQYMWMPTVLTEKYGYQSIIDYSVYDYSLVRLSEEEVFSLYSELALLLTTSGSTGSPKFVRQSCENIISNTKSIVEYLALDSSEKPITTLPMNYTYGLSIINTHLYVGATVLLTDKSLMQEEFWQFFKDQKATSFGGVPYTYEILDKLRFYRMDLPSLRTMTQAGGKLTPELHEKFAKYAEEKGKKFVVMYGQCEATARMSYLPADKAVEKKGSMGVPIPGGRIKLLDIEGEKITTPFTTGELVYEGENVTLGYAEKGEDLIKGDERHGILETGDMAQFDEDGYYYIVGRKKRFLKIYGNRVNLDEIDRLVKGYFDNVDVASAGVDDHMYLFITDGSKAEIIKQFVVNKTKLNPAAFKVVVIDEIPKNDAGKTLYKELTRYYS